MYSSIAFLANGVQTDFTFPFPYLDKAHIAASVDGATAAFTWVGSNTIRLSPAPALNHLVRISRSSNRQQRIADYQDGQLLTEADLDADARQLF